MEIILCEGLTEGRCNLFHYSITRFIMLHSCFGRDDPSEQSLTNYSFSSAEKSFLLCGNSRLAAAMKNVATRPNPRALMARILKAWGCLPTAHRRMGRGPRSEPPLEFSQVFILDFPFAMLFRPPKSAPTRDAQIYARLRPIQKWKESLHKYFGHQIGRRFIRFWADKLAHNWASNWAIPKNNWVSNWDSNLVKLGVKLGINLGQIGSEIGRQIGPNRASNWASN